MIRLLIGLIISLLFTVSCKEEIVFKGSELTPRLVVNCLISPDSIIVAQVKQSNPIQKPTYGNNTVANAVVRLYENSKFIGFLTLNTEEIEIGNTAYSIGEVYSLSGLNLKEGNLYRLEVEASGFEPVSAEVTIPHPVQISTVDTSYITIRDVRNDDARVISFHVKFSDPTSERNYYRLVVRETNGFTGSWGYGGHEGTFYRVRIDHAISLLGSNDVAINPQGSNYEDSFLSPAYNRFFVFSDDLFNGTDATVSVYIKRYTHPWIDIKEFNLYEIELHSISKEYYLYEKSFRQFDHKYDDPFAEPVQVFSNIENGYGIFAAYSIDKFIVLEGVYPDYSDEYTVEYYTLSNSD